MSETPSPQLPRALLISRHSLITRVTHWINLLCIILLLMSGLTLPPELFMKLFGMTNWNFDEPSLPREKSARVFVSSRQSEKSFFLASAVKMIRPALCRVPSYSSPGFPRPKTVIM